MNEETRIYREYCWFALLLVTLSIGFVGRPPPAEMSTRAGMDSVASTPPALAPPAPHTQ